MLELNVILMAFENKEEIWVALETEMSEREIQIYSMK
jgi:hypothetical protein